MKVLLVAVNAKYIHSNPAVYLLRDYVLSQTRGDCPQGVEIRTSEFTINESLLEILAGIAEEKPDFVGISCYIWNWEMVSRLIPEIRKVLPEVKLWLGGPEAAFRAEEILHAYPTVDGVFTGEGEEPLKELIAFYENGRHGLQYGDVLCHGSFSRVSGEGSSCDASSCCGGEQGSGLEKIPGIACRSEGKICRTPAENVENLDLLPFIYHDLSEFRNKILYYESSRGCPFRCAYCLSAAETGLRFRSLPLVEKELQFFLDHRVKQVKFLDRTFNASRTHALGILKYILENDNGCTNFHFELEADLLTEEELELFSKMRPGLVQVEIGVQSTNRKTLAAVSRHTDFRHLTECVRRILENGNLHTHLDLIAGLPYEDYKSFGNSFNEVYALHPHELQLGFLKMLHGTPLAEMAEKYGIKYMSSPPYEVLSTDWLSFEDILRLKRVEAVLEIYYNSGQFSYTMRVLETFFESPFAMYEALADFYLKKGYFVQTPARIRRYDILLEFILQERESFTDAAGALFRELLTYDVYLRENAKSRPVFAPAPELRSRRNEAFHEEYFHFPVDGIRPYGVFPMPELLRSETAHAVRFDYSRRNPVTMGSAVIVGTVPRNAN